MFELVWTYFNQFKAVATGSKNLLLQGLNWFELLWTGLNRIEPGLQPWNWFCSNRFSRVATG